MALLTFTSGEPFRTLPRRKEAQVVKQLGWARCLKIERRFKELARKVKKLYGLDLKTTLRYTYTPRGEKGFEIASAIFKCYNWRIRMDAIFLNAWVIIHEKGAMREVINETMPHEIAHVVCNYTGLGSCHDEGWERVMKSLQ